MYILKDRLKFGLSGRTICLLILAYVCCPEIRSTVCHWRDNGDRWWVWSSRMKHTMRLQATEFYEVAKGLNLHFWRCL